MLWPRRLIAVFVPIYRDTAAAGLAWPGLLSTTTRAADSIQYFTIVFRSVREAPHLIFSVEWNK